MSYKMQIGFLMDGPVPPSPPSSASSFFPRYPPSLSSASTPTLMISLPAAQDHPSLHGVSAPQGKRLGFRVGNLVQLSSGPPPRMKVQAHQLYAAWYRRKYIATATLRNTTAHSSSRGGCGAHSGFTHVNAELGSMKAVNKVIMLKWKNAKVEEEEWRKVAEVYEGRMAEGSHRGRGYRHEDVVRRMEGDGWVPKEEWEF